MKNKTFFYHLRLVLLLFVGACQPRQNNTQNTENQANSCEIFAAQQAH